MAIIEKNYLENARLLQRIMRIKKKKDEIRFAENRKKKNRNYLLLNV